MNWEVDKLNYKNVWLVSMQHRTNKKVAKGTTCKLMVST